MSRRISQLAKRVLRQREDPLTKYIAALEKVYPKAKGRTQVARRDNRIVVSIPLPARAQERMHLFDHMAEIGTRLLLETDQYIIISSQ